MDQNYRLVRSVGYLGLIPFLAGAFLSITNISLPYELEHFTLNFCVQYSAIILSFMGGVLWGFELVNPAKASKNMIVIILVPPLWAAFALTIPLTCFFLALGFAIIYWFDIRSTKERKSPSWWLKLRAPLNTFAIFSLTVMGFNE